MAAKKAPSAKKPTAGKPGAVKRAAHTSTTRKAAGSMRAKTPAKTAKELAKLPAKAERGLAKPRAKVRPAGTNRPADTEAIAERLARAIPDATCELRFKTPFELLIATILSAQSTDKMVNAVMPELLARYPDARALAAAEQEEVELIVKRTGFFRNKAKSIRGAAQRLVAAHEGQVPKTLEALIELPGVARKTANVVLGTAYRITTGVVVDTHVTRVSQRLALTQRARSLRTLPARQLDRPRPSPGSARPLHVPCPQPAMQRLSAQRAVPQSPSRTRGQLGRARTSRSGPGLRRVCQQRRPDRSVGLGARARLAPERRFVDATKVSSCRRAAVATSCLPL
jgi:endonuclease-3